MDFIMNLVSSFKNATISIEDFLLKFKNIFTNLFEIELLAPVKGILDSVLVGTVKALALILVGLLIAAFGQRLLGVGKVVVIALLGFSLGYGYIAPILGFLPEIVVALAVAVVCVILNKFVYLALLAALTAYPIYFLLYTGYFATFGFAAQNFVLCAVVAAAAAFAVIIFRKSIVEKVATAFLGAYLVVYNMIEIFDPRTLVEGDMILFALMGVIALVGLLIQVKTRKRY